MTKDLIQTGPNLKNILCKNKDKLIANIYPGMYQLKCSCGSVYNGETKSKWSTNKKASKVTGRPMEQPNTQRNATAISTCYTLDSRHGK